MVFDQTNKGGHDTDEIEKTIIEMLEKDIKKEGFTLSAKHTP